MPTRTPIAVAALAPIALLAVAPDADAGFIRVFQDFVDVSFPESGRTLSLRVDVETDDLTGVGTERRIITIGTLLEEQNGIGQNFYFISQPDPPGFDAEGSVFVEFDNGAFDYVGTVTLGGNGFTALARNTQDGPITAVAAFGNGEIIYGTTLFNNRYALVNTVVEFIPTPGTGVAMGMSAVGVLVRRRR